MSARISLAVLALGLFLVRPASASDAGYIYGRVETSSGEKYKGQIRWGTEESFWDDIFNATKVENEFLDQLDPKALDRVRSRHWGGWDFFGIEDPGFTHMFAVRFGDLKRLSVRSGDKLVAEFRNGEELELKGGSNDVGAQITVVDPKLGKHELRWNRIRTIEFLETPASLDQKLGEPIYGTVKSGRFEFTGRIQWDHDECLTVDRLDGHTRDGKASIAFGDIASIRKHQSGSMVRLKSGAEEYLTRTNDVDHDNRGVVVIVPKIGTVKIGWDDFDAVTFSKAPNTGRGYSEYAQGGNLSGSVATRSGRHDGRIVFDLDESHDFELLHGRNGDTEYLIPFRDIARIRPKGRFQAQVELRIGLTIELEESQDVTRRNDGLLVFAGQGKPTYVAWKDVTEVEFR